MRLYLTDVYAALRVTSYRAGGVGSCSFSSPQCRGEEGLEKPAKFIIYQDFDRGYRWKLRSGEGATIASSERGHHEQSGCAQEMEHWRLEYPGALVRDATVRGFGKALLSDWLASQSS